MKSRTLAWLTTLLVAVGLMVIPAASADASAAVRIGMGYYDAGYKGMPVPVNITHYVGPCDDAGYMTGAVPKVSSIRQGNIAVTRCNYVRLYLAGRKTGSLVLCFAGFLPVPNVGPMCNDHIKAIEWRWDRRRPL